MHLLLKVNSLNNLIKKPGLDGKISCMDLQRILNSRQAGVWALRISRALPVSLGNLFAQLLAQRLAGARDLPLVRAIRLNRWVASGCELEGEALDQAVKETLRNIAASYYLLFHLIDRPEKLQNQVVFGPEAEDAILASREGRKGLMVVGLHMSNFDLVLQAAAWRGLRATAISLPEETENAQAVEWQHQFRRHSGLEILPASLSNFRQAIRRLREGGLVVTGMDRPINNPKLRPFFFGKPASLPMHYVHLAQEGDVPLILASAIRKQDGKYHMLVSPEIRMKSYPERDEQTLSNAERVLEIAECFIRQAPEQWCIFQPVWPELLGEMP